MACAAARPAAWWRCAELIDASSVGGASFDLGSATYDMTRVITGQLDAYIEPGPRMIEDVPGMRAEFERVGAERSSTTRRMTSRPRRCACRKRARSSPTPTGGDRRLALLGSSHEFQISCLAVANAELHSKIRAAIDAGIERLAARG